jgi:hypothetical protein
MLPIIDLANHANSDNVTAPRFQAGMEPGRDAYVFHSRVARSKVCTARLRVHLYVNPAGLASLEGPPPPSSGC